MPGINIVLVEPEIPQNTGNIARTCAGIGAKLHLVKPLGFSVDNRYLKRAGLDYWHDVEIDYHDSFEEFNTKYSKDNFFYATTKAYKKHTDIDYPQDCFIIFGKETAGLPEKVLRSNKENCIRIPTKSEFRSLNLSNAVAVVAYEILRQKEFAGLECKGLLAKNNIDTI